MKKNKVGEEIIIQSTQYKSFRRTSKAEKKNKIFQLEWCNLYKIPKAQIYFKVWNVKKKDLLASLEECHKERSENDVHRSSTSNLAEFYAFKQKCIEWKILWENKISPNTTVHPLTAACQKIKQRI